MRVWGVVRERERGRRALRGFVGGCVVWCGWGSVCGVVERELAFTFAEALLDSLREV